MSDLRLSLQNTAHDSRRNGSLVVAEFCDRAVVEIDRLNAELAELRRQLEEAEAAANNYADAAVQAGKQLAELQRERDDLRKLLRLDESWPTLVAARHLAEAVKRILENANFSAAVKAVLAAEEKP